MKSLTRQTIKRFWFDKKQTKAILSINYCLIDKTKDQKKEKNIIEWNSVPDMCFQSLKWQLIHCSQVILLIDKKDIET